jgi:hypothetical protein
LRETTNVCRILVEKPVSKCPLERARRRWRDNVKLDFRELGREDGKWLELVLGFAQ